MRVPCGGKSSDLLFPSELQEAQKGDRGFAKDFEEILNDSRELQGMKEDKEFLGKLLPKK
jgi:hypothetical protein